MTNLERIQKMEAIELTKLMGKISECCFGRGLARGKGDEGSCAGCPLDECRKKPFCYPEDIYLWLNKEVKE